MKTEKEIRILINALKKDMAFEIETEDDERYVELCEDKIEVLEWVIGDETK